MHGVPSSQSLHRKRSPIGTEKKRRRRSTLCSRCVDTSLFKAHGQNTQHLPLFRDLLFSECSWRPSSRGAGFFFRVCEVRSQRRHKPQQMLSVLFSYDTQQQTWLVGWSIEGVCTALVLSQCFRKQTGLVVCVGALGRLGVPGLTIMRAYFADFYTFLIMRACARVCFFFVCLFVSVRVHFSQTGTPDQLL